MKLTTQQIEIIANGVIEGNKFYLQGQLSPKEYKSINDVLESIGLKWNRKEKAHIYEEENAELLVNAIDEIIDTGECTTIKEIIKKYQFFPTPQEVVDMVIELADIKTGEYVLEPSAGNGNILKSIPKDTYITAIELNPDFYDELVDIIDGSDYKGNVIVGDFLDFNENNGEWDKIVMNPPFSKSQDVKHILHAYDLLGNGGVLVAVASEGAISKNGTLYDELKSLNPEVFDLPEGSFKSSGTMVNTIVIRIKK